MKNVTISLLTVITGKKSTGCTLLVPVRFIDRFRILFTGKISCYVRIDILPKTIKSGAVEAIIYDEMV